MQLAIFVKMKLPLIFSSFLSFSRQNLTDFYEDLNNLFCIFLLSINLSLYYDLYYLDYENVFDFDFGLFSY
jgi:hypothetical protein